MSTDGVDVAGFAARLRGALDGDGAQRFAAGVPLEAVQDLVAAAAKLYVAKLAEREPEEAAAPPFREDGGLTATDVVVLAGKLLEAADIDVFELQMWRTLGRA